MVRKSSFIIADTLSVDSLRTHRVSRDGPWKDHVKSMKSHVEGSFRGPRRGILGGGPSKDQLGEREESCRGSVNIHVRPTMCYVRILC